MTNKIIFSENRFLKINLKRDKTKHTFHQIPLPRPSPQIFYTHIYTTTMTTTARTTQIYKTLFYFCLHVERNVRLARARFPVQVSWLVDFWCYCLNLTLTHTVPSPDRLPFCCAGGNLIILGIMFGLDGSTISTHFFWGNVWKGFEF